ncbi:LuxR family transcriptional regulator [Paraburkholderia flava]|uniref:LuxR family transcriptional regulator n=1 Tax=Paraburkholderia flava TaxID=2547393 RepID=UPI0014152925|nr:LuxR family transcriptional regulator [Paraburkholderia flava]
MEITESHELIPTVLEIGTLEDPDMLGQAIVRLGRKLGFDSMLYGGRFAMDSARNIEQRVTSNYHPNWRATYDQENYIALDPVVVHAMNSLAPIVWSSAMGGSPGQKQFWEEASGYGLKAGVSFSVQTRDGDFGILSLALDKNGRDAQRQIATNIMWGPLIVTMAQEAMRRIVKGSQPQLRPRLTPREWEILRWLAAGKSTEEISVILSVSEHGVVYHVRNLLHKFGTRTRGQIVIKAMSLGML